MLDEMRTIVGSGDGLVARADGYVLLITTPNEGTGDLLAEVRANASSAQGASVLARYASERAMSTPSFGAIVPSAVGTDAVLFGEVELVADGRVVSGSAPDATVEEVRAGDMLTMRATGAERPDGALYDLVAGIVPGSAVTLELRAAPVETLPQADPTLATGPTVKGVLCAKNHFNHPEVLYCSSCGRSLVHRTRHLVDGVRPPLGVIVLEDGSSYVLDRDYTIGSAPTQDQSVGEGRARPLVIDDGGAGVGAVHARIRLEGWAILLTDLGTRGGTWVIPPEGSDWQAVRSGIAIPIWPGTSIAMGQRTLVVEGHHHGV